MAQAYSLTLDLDPASLAALSRAGVRLALAKPAGVYPPNVIWIACELAKRVTITWTDVYGVYAAAVPFHENERIRIRSTRYPARNQALHPFSGERFTAPVVSETIPLDHYDVLNCSSSAFAFGLLQAVAVNGAALRSPINATTLAPRFSADFVTASTLYIWTQHDIESGATTAHVPTWATRVAFNRNDCRKRYRYAPDRSTFIDASAISENVE